VGDTIELTLPPYRQLVAIRYLNASEAIWNGLQRQCGSNEFHFLVTLRSFIEYTRRGIWFLAWASEEKLKKAEHLTFKDAGSPPLSTMDALLNEALGQGKVSPLMNLVPVVNEPFLHCLHALTHGNPISVRMIGMGLESIFDTKNLLARAELDLGIFRILLYRHMSGEEIGGIWAMLSTIHNRPNDIKASVMIAAHVLKQSGKTLPT
jgi:hypothetical protein